MLEGGGYIKNVMLEILFVFISVPTCQGCIQIALIGRDTDGSTFIF